MNNKTVTIVSIWTKHTAADQPFTYTVEVPASSTDTATLESAFAMTNRDDRPNGNRVCSTSAGDIMGVDNRWYLVEGTGYHPLTEMEVEALKRLTSRDTGMGYQWCLDRQMFPTH